MPSLKLHGDQIEYVPRYFYLGIILNHRMNWKPHVEVLTGRAHRPITALSPLLRSSLFSRAKCLTYKTYIRPMVTYTASDWKFITISNMQSLQVVQNRALKLIGGYDRHTRIGKIHSETFVLWTIWLWNHALLPSLA